MLLIRANKFVNCSRSFLSRIRAWEGDSLIDDILLMNVVLMDPMDDLRLIVIVD